MSDCAPPDEHLSSECTEKLQLEFASSSSASAGPPNVQKSHSKTSIRETQAEAQFTMDASSTVSLKSSQWALLVACDAGPSLTCTGAQRKTHLCQANFSAATVAFNRFQPKSTSQNRTFLFDRSPCHKVDSKSCACVLGQTNS